MNMKTMLKDFLRIIKNFIFTLRKRSKYLFLGSPEHGNLGDHAIAISCIKFLRKNSKHRFTEISYSEYFRYKDLIVRWSPLLLTIIGGGNMGDLWPNEEDFHIDVIKTFSKSKIVFFPQSIWFNNENGQYFKEMHCVYNNHSNLNLFAREEYSFCKMKSLFPSANVFMAPDMVLSLCVKKEKCNIGKKLLVLKRTDKETDKQSSLKISEIINLFKGFGYTVEYADTVLPFKVTKKNRKKHLKLLFKKIKNHSIVLTDRLHGMVFSYICNTPCVVYSNNTQKVKGTYNWLKGDENIVFSPDNNRLMDFIKNINNGKMNETVKFDYGELRRVLNEK